MPEVSHLTRPKPTNATIDLGEGDSVAIVFDRNKVTPHWANETQERANAQDVLAVSKALAEVLISWDVTQEGQAFEPTSANISIFSLTAQSELVTKIMEASVPGAAEGEGSNATSSTPATASSELPASPQNGPQPSPSPEPSTSASLT